MKDKPIVSVRLMTYNHSMFIREAMDGIMKQKTSFPVEVVIGDDFSSDNNLDIIRSYKSTDKIKIRILDRQIGDTYWIKRQEIGRLYNFVDILENCTGEYIALLDGDDYWADENKLQKQYEIIKRGYAVVYHNNAKHLNGKVVPTRAVKDYEFNFKDSVCSKNGNTVGMMFRRALLDNWKLQIFKEKDLFTGDWPLECLLTLGGKGYFMSEVLGYYRVHEAGVSRRLNQANYYNGRFIFFKKLIDRRSWIGEENYLIVVEAYYRLLTTYFLFCLRRREFTELMKIAAHLRSLPLNSFRYTRGWKKSFSYTYILDRALKSKDAKQRINKTILLGILIHLSQTLICA